MSAGPRPDLCEKPQARDRELMLGDQRSEELMGTKLGPQAGAWGWGLGLGPGAGAWGWGLGLGPGAGAWGWGLGPVVHRP
ncbi:hypothetical protein NHX12_032132 [Muraenolepis orangiensis]|uniref:Uncharacterized protein n=1 Tax=Muraenolepis orangiensis TaxID=630683 RepID=A0A9Q0E545_9TELE|nr:hypothetical protein NHX12_032132 [Muraenolepis orangiensis]